MKRTIVVLLSALLLMIGFAQATMLSVFFSNP
jgi:hypothetical protein